MKLDSAAVTASIAAAKSKANCTVRRALKERNGRTSLIVRHCHRRRRPQPDLEAQVPLAPGDSLTAVLPRRPQVRVPDGDPCRWAGRAGEAGNALHVGAGFPRGVGHETECAHLVVDVE